MIYYFVIVRIVVFNVSYFINFKVFKDFIKFSLFNDYESFVICYFIFKIRDEGIEGKQLDFSCS